MKKRGDCFEANGSVFYFYISNSNFKEIEFVDIMKEQTLDIMPKIKKWRLIHSTPLHEVDRKPFGHCWIEGDDYVFDFTTNSPYNKVLHFKVEYYLRFGIPPKEHLEDWKGIEDKYHRFEYTFDDVGNKIKQLKGNMNWGSWDFECER